MAGQSVEIRGGNREFYLTVSAAAKVLELRDTPKHALRFAVRPGGCSGFSYEMYFDSEIDDSDVVEEFDGVTVVVDKDSIEKLRGLTLDYDEDELLSSGFSIDNPNVTRSCGCGSSFS